MVLKYFSRQVDEEFSQALARVIISALALLISGIAYASGTIAPLAPAALVLYLLLSLAWAAYVRRSPGRNPVRLSFSILGDLGIVSFGMFTMDSFGAFFYPLYLWIIVGNGMRFGERYLLAALAIGIFGFTMVISFGDYWRANLPTALGLLTGLIILPVFYLVLIRRLHALNSQLARELKQSYYAASHDALTGLVNRAYFFERLDIEIERTQRYRESFVIMFIDLDNFKEINDAFGHQAGDQVLVAVADRLRGLTRKADIVARLGGDEFTILFPSLSGAENIETVSRSVVESISRPIDIDANMLSVTVSVGISTCPQHGNSADELIHKADVAMYRAKDEGKNNFAIFA